MSPQEPALLLIGHGTRTPRGGEEMEQLLTLVREDVGLAGHGWLEDFADPDPVTAAGELVQAGATALVTLPFLVLGAGHAKTDVPRIVAAIHDAYPGLPVSHGSVLGLHSGLLALARQKVLDARGPGPVSEDEALLVTGSGSSDPDANSDLAKAARFLAETTGHTRVELGFAGVTWPTADMALRRLAAAGARRVVRFSWSLLAGLLERRVDDWAAEVAAETGMDMVDAGRFGPERQVADAVVNRYHEALSGDTRMNCDLCQYRLPLPGRESRAGAPSAGGTGERLHPEAREVQRSRSWG